MTGVIWLPGVGWDASPGTDRRLVPELAARRPVIWIDPPVSVLGRRAAVDTAPAPGVIRVPTVSAPGMTRIGSRELARARVAAAARAAAGAHGPIDAVVLARPLLRFPRGVEGARILYATDDWIAGAELMGMSPSAIRADLTAAVREADAVVAVTPRLLETLADLGARRDDVPWEVIPNGAPRVGAASDAVREPVAGLIGQLNERLDLDALERTVAAGVPIRVFGTVTARDPASRARIERLLASPGVDWRGAVASERLAEELQGLAVGLTPYDGSPFNQASFPLKTLDYLAAGMPVVSTDLSASRWMDTPHVSVATDADAFAREVERVVRDPADGADAERRALAEGNGWDQRAARFDELIKSVRSGAARG